MEKQRLDLLLYEKGLAPSREKARALIMAGEVYIEGQKYDKPGTQISADCEIEVRGEALRYVSRGGLKLEKAMEEFPITPKAKICMDIGASTGGFTDCMLQNGAKRVYAVDVGYGQLAWSLRNDARVINLERTNVRYLKEEQVPEKIEFFSVDVSFISLRTVLPAAAPFFEEGAEGVVLIKPQFEAGREKVGKNGVVRDKKVHLQVASDLVGAMPALGFAPLALTFSPIKGPKGNIEYLLWIKKSAEAGSVSASEIERVVARSHEELDACE